MANSVIGKHLHRVGSCRLVRLSDTSIVEGDHLELLPEGAPLEKPRDFRCRETHNEEKWLSLSLDAVVDVDPVHSRYGHLSSPIQTSILVNKPQSVYNF